MRSGTLVVFGLALVAVACSNDDKGGTSDVLTGATDTSSVTDGFVQFDTGTGTTDSATVEDTSPPGDATPGGFGAPCQGNKDCDSGWCVEGPEGYICTEECLETCPTGYDCRSVTNVQGDIVFLCLPRIKKLCAPCLQDFQCNGGACLTIDGEGMCATGCETNEECPRGYGCAADATGAKPGTFCQPLSGSCSCSPTFEGVARTCSATNALGTCLGSETCDPEQGWVGCTARTPSTESCNYIDDDCDGDVDEDFQADGVYASVTACGSCTTNCDEVLPNTAETRCAVAGGLARCEVVTCDDGFTLLNPYVCAPDAGSSCQPCEADAQCVGVGSACVALSDGKFCTTACTDSCDEGFTCQTVPESTTKQCVPTSGSCTCDGTNTDLSRACTVTYTPPDPEAPTVTCRGLEQCTANGWGGCVLPEEACDGIDNDCDGVIDQPFKTGDKYTAVEHCGACDVSCAALSGPNAQPACDAGGAVPTCSYTCVGGAVDVNGIAEDGCECEPLAGPDLAGDSLDSNCDGIDGEVTNGIFVAKSGVDTNPGTRELPVLTVQAGITKAKAGGKRDTYVATGVYSENVILAEGVGVFGGYAPFFDEHDTTLYETALVGQAPTAQSPGTVTAIGLGTVAGAAETVLDGFTVFGINAANLVAQNSYAIYIRDSGTRLRVSKNRIFAGAGGNGQNGTRGSDGALGLAGTGGGAARNLTVDCNTSTAGGAAGARVCGGVDVGGGKGGNAVCAVWGAPPDAEQAGGAGKGTGAGAGGAPGWDLMICAGAFDFECGAAECGTCYLPPDGEPFTGTPGQPGASGAPGSAGTGCTNAAGTVTAGHWVGGGGGTGGAVGHGAVGGAGGTSGGGSFGLFVTGGATALPRLEGNTIQAGRGGAGGKGGPAGVGGTGGSGGLGGVSGDTLEQANVRCAEGGGAGGEGGDGGHGGGGGGACGGAAYGLHASVPSPPAIWKTGNTFIAGGVGGGGGKGGASVDQTRAGIDGAAGAAANTNF